MAKHLRVKIQKTRNCLHANTKMSNCPIPTDSQLQGGMPSLVCKAKVNSLAVGSGENVGRRAIQTDRERAQLDYITT